MLHTTRFGRYTYAIGSNEEAARRAGVKVDRHLIRLRACRHARRRRGDPVPRPVRHDHDRRPVADQPERDRRRGDRRHVDLRRDGTIFGTVVGLFIPAVLQSGFVIIGVAAVLAGRRRRPSSSPPSTSTSPAAPPPARAQRIFAKSRQTSQRRKRKERQSTVTVTARSPAPSAPLVLALAGLHVVQAGVAPALGADERRRPAGGGDRRVTGAHEGAKNYKMTFIQGVQGDEFYITMQCGIEAEAAKLGVTVNTQGPQKFDPTLQKPIVDSVVASKPDAILVAPTDVQAMQRRSQQAAAPASRSSSSTPRPTTRRMRCRRSPRDNEGGGAAAFEAISELRPGGGKVLVMSTDPGISTTDARVKGFEDGRQGRHASSTTSASSTATTTRRPPLS